MVRRGSKQFVIKISLFPLPFLSISELLWLSSQDIGAIKRLQGMLKRVALEAMVPFSCLVARTLRSSSAYKLHATSNSAL